MIQDITGLGIKKIAYIYDFMGNVLQVAYQPGQAEAFYHHYEYDADQRVTHVYTSKDGINKTLQAHYEYYLHGPLKRVEVGGNLQGTDYLYTLQGGLKSINHGDMSKDPGADGVASTENENFLPDAFGMNLLYHDQDYTAAGYDFGNYAVSGSTDSYSGNIKAISWHNANNSNEQVMYDYRYDEKYQLTNAKFGNVNQSGNNYSFQEQVNRYAVGVTYQNSHGNIGTLNRKDEDGIAIGNYNYNYKTNSNQLEDVKHNGASFIDYQYNAIGQMTSQTEAGMGEMHLVYDAYGMVKEIYANAAKTLPLVKFAYDDRGNRLLKKSYDTLGNLVLDTWYVRDDAGMVLSVYTHDHTHSSFITQAEIPVYGSSRIGMYLPAEDAYIYEITDHIGNVRSVLVAETRILPFTATMEPAQAAYEEAEFVNIANTRHQDLLNSKTGSHSAHLNHSMGKINGPGIGLKINPGDKVDITAYAKYESGLQNFNNNFEELILAFASSFGYNGGSETAKIFDMFDQLPAGVLPGDEFDVPKAYIIGLFFDNYFNYVDANLYSRITEEADGHWQELTGSRTFDQPGYLYIITATENKDNVDIFFDDIHIDLYQTRIVAGNDYYPFGLPIVERSYERENYRFDYQGLYSEKDDETGWNAFQLRMYDARIGRWISPDPYGQFHSPYVAMANSPHQNIDRDGGFTEPLYGGILPGVTVTAQRMADLTSQVAMQMSLLSMKMAAHFSSIQETVRIENKEYKVYYNESWNSASADWTNPTNTHNSVAPKGLELASVLTLDNIQMGIDAAGWIPGVQTVAGLASAGIDVYNGNYLSAMLGVATAIPLLGYAAKAFKAVRAAKKMAGVAKRSKGLMTPNKFFNSVSQKQAQKILTKKYGQPVFQNQFKKSFYNPRTRRSFTIHNEPGHGLPHVDINTRGWPRMLNPRNQSWNHQLFNLK